MMLVFVGHEKMPYRSFFYYNLLANLFWIVLVITLGILMGFSWNFLEQYNYYSRYLVFSGLAILVALRFIFKKFLSFREYEPGN
jgi:membrane protein DedA with SNARE-associated domain